MARESAAPGWKRSRREVPTPNHRAGAALLSESHPLTQRTAANFGPVYGPYALPILLRELKPAPFRASKAIVVAARLISFQSH